MLEKYEIHTENIEEINEFGENIQKKQRNN